MADNEMLVTITNHDDDEEGLGFGEEGPEAKLRLRQPVMAFFHIAFRAAAILIYILCGAFGTGFIPSFVTVIVLLALDFWTVKNITGRKLVGLRWTNYVDEAGESHWVFEGRTGIRAGGRMPERRIFWTALIVTPIVWLLLLFSTFVRLNFQWTILAVLALLLNGANLYGYVRCKLGHQPGIADASSVFGSGFASLIFRAAAAGVPSMGRGDNNAANTFSHQV